MVELKGFMGTILDVNLTTKEIKKIPLDENLAVKFLGGAGYATATLLPLLNKDTDPLGPENIMFFMTGPLCGTMGTCTGRFVVYTKSPATGILGESCSGNMVGVQIKKAGYDGIIIRGASKTPVYLEIIDDNVSIKDATNIWGKGIYETEEILKNSENLKRAKIMAIGPAGENLVKFAIIGGEERAFGRTGVGAVMGSKKLKAVVAKGKKKVELANLDGFKEAVKRVTDTLMEVFTMQMFGELGTAGGLSMYEVMGELPVKYYRTSIFPDTNSIDGAAIQDNYLKKQRHCYACPVGCGRVIEVEKAEELGVPKGLISGPEYETMAGFGSMMMNTDIEAIIKSNYICNNLGLDTISASSTIALLMDLIDRGKISTSDIDNIDLKWGAMNEVHKLLNKISSRDGVGDILAEGSGKVGEHFKIDKDQVAAIKGVATTYHDMRSSNGMAIAYAISPNYGASHCACDVYMTTTGLAHDDMGIESVDSHSNGVDMAEISAKLMEYRAFHSSVVLCIFAVVEAATFSKLIELGIGIPFGVDETKLFGERILSLKRLFNLKMGHTPKDEYVPKILRTSLPEGGTEGNVPDTDALFSEFYKYEDWDPESGMPSKAKLEKLGLTEFAKF